MIDTDKYEGHTPGPLKVRRHYDNDLWCVADEKDYLVMQTPFPDECSHTLTDGDHYANAQLMAAAPLLLAEVKRLRRRLMLAESALGEVRVCHETGQGNLGEIIAHYRDKEGVEMPSVFDDQAYWDGEEE